MRTRRIPLTALLLAASVTGMGCVWAGHRSSPWEWGGGARVAPGFPVGHGGTTVHPVLTYEYLKWDGGHDDLIELGGQIRRPLLRRPDGATSLWVGAEAAWATLHSSGGGFSASTSGWSLGGLAGVPVFGGKWGPSLFLAAGISHYGANGVNVRLGVDLQPWFLRR